MLGNALERFPAFLVHAAFAARLGNWERPSIVETWVLITSEFKDKEESVKRGHRQLNDAIIVFQLIKNIQIISASLL